MINFFVIRSPATFKTQKYIPVPSSEVSTEIRFEPAESICAFTISLTLLPVRSYIVTVTGEEEESWIYSSAWFLAGLGMMKKSDWCFTGASSTETNGAIAGKIMLSIQAASAPEATE